MVIYCKTVAQYHKQDTDTYTNDQSYSYLLSFPCTDVYVCVYLVLYNFITCVGSCIYYNNYILKRLPWTKLWLPQNSYAKVLIPLRWYLKMGIFLVSGAHMMGLVPL